MDTRPNPPPQIAWNLRKQRKGKYNYNNPIIHVLCVQTQSIINKLEVTFQTVNNQ